MKYDFTEFTIIAHLPVEKKAAEIFACEVNKRIGILPEISEDKGNGKFVELNIKDKSPSEQFSITHDENRIVITAHRLRGLIYGFALIFRKSVIRNGNLTICKNLSCNITASMPIRGHQISYSHMNNTHDAWSLDTFRQYILELMFFGTNIIEGVSNKVERNSMMKYSFNEIISGVSNICQDFDIDFSLWYPLSKSMTDDETNTELNSLLETTPMLNVLFPPGGDPGDMLPEDFIERCCSMKNELNKSFPNAEMWPSAQAPHEYRDWGKRFTEKINKLPSEINGLIYGPNHAMPLDEMRRNISIQYPIRFYPDITHNVRCEVPVHFNRDDWHYSLAATLSREAVNPRPTEYRLLHRITKQYVCGSVSYSEGVNDDINKAIFSSLDFDCNADIRETINDYARAYIPETNCEKFTDAIFGLEQNWVGDPAENSSIENTYRIFLAMLNSTPKLSENWRFMLHYFRACCDKIVRDRRLFELNLISEAKAAIYLKDTETALKILRTDFSNEYKALRAEIFTLAQTLFELIGIQLDVEHFGGMQWERGCTLDTIDNPVTDRQWYLKKLNENKSAVYAQRLFERNNVASDEYYFSFAEHGFDIAGKQDGEYYMDFCGDSNFNALLPMCMTKVYDHFNFKCNVAGLTGGDYKLRITYKIRQNDKIIHHKISVNSKVIYEGKQFGGVRDEQFEKDFLAPGFLSIVYDIPKELFENGCAQIEITEPLDGFMISEFWIVK